MQYLITFLEGIITFISPCLLPMLPVYISYFAGEESDSGRTVRNALGFIAGFSTVFVLLGAFAGSIGTVLKQYQTVLNIVTGLIVIVFGLSFLGVFRVKLFQGGSLSASAKITNPFRAFVFGMVFSIGWTPCVGSFLGSALMLASQQGSALQGVLLLLAYSLGLGIPFFLSALLIDRLKNAFAFIKKHYALITRIAGLFLIAVGILMATGLFGRFLTMLSS